MINGLALCDLHIDRVEGGYIDTSNPIEYRVKATSRDGKVTLSAGKPKPNIDRFNLCFFTGTIFIEKNTTFIIKNRGLPILLPWTGLYGFDRETSVFLLDEIKRFDVVQWIRNWNPIKLTEQTYEYYLRFNKDTNLYTKTYDISLFWSGLNTLSKFLNRISIETITTFSSVDLLIDAVKESGSTKFILKNINILSKKSIKIKLCIVLSLRVSNSVININHFPGILGRTFTFILCLLNVKLIDTIINVQLIENSNGLIQCNNLFLIDSKIIIKNIFIQTVILETTNLNLSKKSIIYINGVKELKNKESDNKLIPNIILYSNVILNGASGITIAKGTRLLNEGTIILKGDNICPTILNGGTLVKGTIITLRGYS